jgi:hypothetical protein
MEEAEVIRGTKSFNFETKNPDDDDDDDYQKKDDSDVFPLLNSILTKKKTG